MLKSWLTFCTPKSRNIVRNILKAQENGHVMTSQQIYQTARQQFPDEHDLIKEDVVVNYKNEPAMKVNRRPTPPTSRMGRPAVPSNHPLQSLRYLKKVVMEDLVARDEVIKVRVWRGSGGVDEEGNKMDLIVHKGSDNQPVKSLSLLQKESWMWQLNAEKMVLEEEPAESNGPDDDPLLGEITQLKLRFKDVGPNAFGGPVWDRRTRELVEQELTQSNLSTLGPGHGFDDRAFDSRSKGSYDRQRGSYSSSSDLRRSTAMQGSRASEGRGNTTTFRSEADSWFKTNSANKNPFPRGYGIRPREDLRETGVEEKGVQDSNDLRNEERIWGAPDHGEGGSRDRGRFQSQRDQRRVQERGSSPF